MSDNISRTKNAILAINKSPENGTSYGGSKNRFPGPAVQKIAVYAKGGAVKKPFEGSKKDMTEDAKLASKYKMSMKTWEKSPQDKKHDKQESAKGLAKGGKACYAKGGKVTVKGNLGMIDKNEEPEKGGPDDKLYKDEASPKTVWQGQNEKTASKVSKNQAVQGIRGAEKKASNQGLQGVKGSEKKTSNQSVLGMKGVPMKAKNQGVQGFAKGGKVGHVKAIKGLLKGINDKLPMVAAAQAARPKIISPPPPAGIGGGGMPPAPPMGAGAPPMQPGMKMGGKVKKLAAGGVAKLRKVSPTPDKIKMVNYPKGG